MTLLADRYELGGLLGAGGLGAVLRARDRMLSREVAVKVVRQRQYGDSSNLARLIREANAMARINHPNVVAVFDVRRYAGLDYYDIDIDVPPSGVAVVMEYVRGQDLAGWLERRREPGEILRVFAAAAQGLAAAHAQGIVHRDFKPANVLVGDDGQIKVTDFGLASAWTADPPGDRLLVTHADTNESARWIVTSQLTGTGLAMGTPLYMAPEQHRAKAVDPRTDQYAWSIALLGALTGRRPIDGTSFSEILRQKQSLQVPAELPITPRARAALQRGLSEDPGDRFESLAQLVAQLIRPRARTRVAIVAALTLTAVAGLAIPDRDRSAETADDPTDQSAMPADTTAAHTATMAAIEALVRQTGVISVAEYQRRALDNLDRARASGSPAAVARALLGRAAAEGMAKDRDARLRTTHQAYALASETGDEVIAARAASMLYYYEDPETEASMLWLRAAEAHLQRCGGDARAEQNLLTADRERARGAGRLEEALALTRQLHVLYQDNYGHDSTQAANELLKIAELSRETGAYADAVEAFEQALQILDRHYMPTETTVIESRADLAYCAALAANEILAREELTRVEAAFYARPPDDGRTALAAFIWQTGAMTLQVLGDHEGALSYFRRSPITDAQDMHGRFSSHAHIAESLLALGRRDEAIAELKHALTFVDVNQPERPARVQARQRLAELEAANAD